MLLLEHQDWEMAFETCTRKQAKAVIVFPFLNLNDFSAGGRCPSTMARGEPFTTVKTETVKTQACAILAYHCDPPLIWKQQP